MVHYTGTQKETEGLFSSFDSYKIDLLGCILALFKESDSNTSQIRNSAIRDTFHLKAYRDPGFHGRNK